VILPRRRQKPPGENESTRRLIAFVGITIREIEVLEGVASGERNKEIAYRLGITERTIKAHRTHIYQKLNVDSRAAAVAEASKLDLL
jgi:NarL family two-component system response regulator YdfI